VWRCFLSGDTVRVFCGGKRRYKCLRSILAWGVSMMGLCLTDGGGWLYGK